MGYALKNVVAKERAYKGATQQVYEYLAERYNDEYLCTWVSVGTITRDTDLSRRSVQYALRRLEADQRISAHDDNTGGGQWVSSDGVRHGMTTRWTVYAAGGREEWEIRSDKRKRA